MKKAIIVFAIIAAGFAASTGYFAYQNDRLNEEIADLKDRLEKSDDDIQVSDGNYVDTDDTAQKAAIEDLLVRYVEKLTHSGGDLTYGQAPSVASFLTDNGILEALKEYAPYTTFTDDDVAKVRELEAQYGEVDTDFTFDHETYVKLNENEASAVFIYEGTYENGHSDTVISYVGGVLEFDLVKDDTNGWLIDSTTKELLF